MPSRSTSRASAALVAAVVGVALACAAADAHADEPPFSASAAKTADTTLAVVVTTPVALQIAGGVNDNTGGDLLLYGESLTASLLFNLGAKYAFKRPRPYTTSANPRIRKYAEGQEGDASLSFYSGHSTMAFTAAVAGSLLFRSEDEYARGAVWGFNMALASATANFRVRAGKHYYSDVIAGAIIGTGFGILFPSLHLGVDSPGTSAPTATEWAFIGGGLLVGIVGSQLIPMPRDIIEPLDSVTPVAYEGGGGGVVFSGSF
jgi:membrane-associated phospholipid phosphatase